MKTPPWVNVVLGLVLAVGAGERALATEALTAQDCVKCHDLVTRQIATRGMAHKDQVTCLDCHVSHRPLTAHNIPACGDCHGATPHREMTDCASCHAPQKNCQACHLPHQPLARTAGKIPELHCRVCHPDAFKALQANASKHHKLSCGVCHTEHRAIPHCADCHGRPHSQGTHQMFRCNDCHGVAHDLVIMPKKS